MGGLSGSLVSAIIGMTVLAFTLPYSSLRKAQAHA
jgi:hypothetical protein